MNFYSTGDPVADQKAMEASGMLVSGLIAAAGLVVGVVLTLLHPSLATVGLVGGSALLFWSLDRMSKEPESLWPFIPQIAGMMLEVVCIGALVS